MQNDIIFSRSFIFRVFKGSSYMCNDSHGGVKHNYLAYMTKGNARLCAEGGEEVTVNEGDVFFIPNGCRYRSHWYGYPDIEFISLSFGFMPSFEGKYYPPQVISARAEEVELLKSVLSAGESALGVALLYSAVAMLLPKMRYEMASGRNETVERVRRIIAKDPHKSISEIAKECAVSESLLYSVFHRDSEKSIGKMKREALMESAEEMLLLTELPIEAISSSLGFSSPAYFRKCFKEHFSLSPREFRKSARKSAPIFF